MLYTAGGLETAGSQALMVCNVELWRQCSRKCAAMSIAVKSMISKPRFMMKGGVLANKVNIDLVYFNSLLESAQEGRTPRGNQEDILTVKCSSMMCAL